MGRKGDDKRKFTGEKRVYFQEGWRGGRIQGREREYKGKEGLGVGGVSGA